jgi:hypothetical protein
MRSASALVALLLVMAAPGIAGAQTSTPIRVDRSRAGIPIGSMVTINVSGANGPLTVTPSFDGADAAYDPITRRLTVIGRAAGSGTLTLTDRQNNTATIAVLVGALAGALPQDVDIALAGTVSAAFVTARIRDAIERGLVRRPGTALDIHGITPPAFLSPGDKLEAQAGVTLDGRGTYVDVTARTNVHVHVDVAPPLDPALLFYSDDPEYATAQLSGVLFRGTVDLLTPARLFSYHVADGAPRRMWLVLRAAVPTRVQMLGTISGASPAYGYIGQQSSARFLAARATGESTIAAVVPGTPYAVALGLMQPGDLIEAIQDMRVLSGGPLDVALVTSPASEAMPPLDGPELAGDSHGRRGVFALGAVTPIDLSFTAGAQEPVPVPVGDAVLANKRAGERPLGGDYGVVRPVVLHLANSTPTEQNIYLYELTSGAGGATATFWFSGDTAATIVPCIDDAVQPHAIKTFVLAPGETRSVTGSFMTDGSSSYPVRFGLSSTAPLPVPPGACAPTFPSRVP